MEQIECSETSAYINQMPGNHPKENKQHSEHGESLKSIISLSLSLSLSFFVFQVSTFVPYVMQLKSEMQARFTSVERILEYTEV